MRAVEVQSLLCASLPNLYTTYRSSEHFSSVKGNGSSEENDHFLVLLEPFVSWRAAEVFVPYLTSSSGNNTIQCELFPVIGTLTPTITSM